MKSGVIKRRDMLKSILAFSVGLGMVSFTDGVKIPPETEKNRKPRNRGILIEAGSFENFGGWILDTEFIAIMGSPYLMAHGLGVPVPDATTTVRFPQTGKWRVWVRTRDWVARWNAPGAPGRFQLLIDKIPVKETFGTKGKDWHWHDGGMVEISKKDVTLALHDLTGFNGRCDAIYFTGDTDGNPPPDDSSVLPQWRQELLNLPVKEESSGIFDLVVAGGGYAGMGAAISAARMGLKVALIQDRPVFGGNASSEIRVPPRGLMPTDGPYPNLGKIIYELLFDKNVEARQAVEKDDAIYDQVLNAEKNITLFRNHSAYDVEMDNKSIKGVRILDTHSSSRKLIKGHFFSDCTGHATLGALAGADYMIGAYSGSEFKISRETPLMGMTNKWMWEMTSVPQRFPETPWALNLTMDDFPLHNPGIWGNWCWESGFFRHPIDDLEYIRDWNFRAVFGAWNALKNKEKAAEYSNARLAGLCAIGGPRESRRLLGEYVLTGDDMVKRIQFDDGFVPVGWFLDRHIPHEKYNKKYPDDPFIAVGWDKIKNDIRPRHGNPWWGIPYRCLYSRNIPNLFMAGRNISTDYMGLGPVRVMRTCGMMGEVVGKAAAVCIDQDCRPKDVYHSHLEKLKLLI